MVSRFHDVCTTYEEFTPIRRIDNFSLRRNTHFEYDAPITRAVGTYRQELGGHATPLCAPAVVAAAPAVVPYVRAASPVVYRSASPVFASSFYRSASPCFTNGYYF